MGGKMQKQKWRDFYQPFLLPLSKWAVKCKKTLLLSTLAPNGAATQNYKIINVSHQYQHNRSA
jgi:hypothetical protein